MTQRTLTALFDSRDDAEEAREDLLECGVASDDINIVSQSASATTTAASGSSGGLWDGIKGLFIGDDDRSAYAEGVSRGGFLLTARVEEDRTDEAYRILEDNSKAVNFDERQEQWRASGWTGEQQKLGASDQDEQRIPIVEEQLKVGKREVERGGARVRSYVVETPVQEQVQLREEHVEVERRPTDQRISVADADNLFQDREIELTERSEEAVVSKDAVVTEELRLRKDVETRTEQVSDTVRHTEVDVDKIGGEARSFTSTTENVDLTDEELARRSSESSSDTLRP